MTVPQRMSYAAYDLVSTTLLAAAVPFLPLVSLMRVGAGLSERLGSVPDAARALAHPVWIHAASVGEVLAAAPLVEGLRQQCPQVPLVISTTTLSGRETARTRLPVDVAMLLPLDVRWIAERVVRALQPRCLVLVETELWPALIGAAARHGVPRLIVSGRISARSVARYAWAGALMRGVLSQIDAFAMQTVGDAERIISLGAAPERVEVLGSLKLARAGAAAELPGAARALADGRPVLMAASTHPGEERLALQACAGLWAHYADLLLVLAPRRPERFDEVARLLEEQGMRAERRTLSRDRIAASTQVLLVDTLGELSTLMPAARAVFVGGTIAAVGGHNVAEPALFGKPVTFGPHTETVAETAAALVGAGAATRVHDADELAVEWRRALEQPEVAERMGANGRAVVVAQAAVAERTIALVRRFMGAGRAVENVLTSGSGRGSRTD